MEKEELIRTARSAMRNAYAPYSKYHVGAALLCRDGTVYIGANIENASLGATSCAERNAVFAAYSHGVRKEDIQALVIVSDGDRVCAPCGICRQVLCELLDHHTPICLSNGKEEVDTDIDALLPMQFNQEDVLR
jgi:cytidine deaminase